jgi:hypothetical protein
MALAYDVSGSVVRAVIIGPHTLSEVRALLDVGLSDPRVGVPLRLLIDASEAAFSDSLEEACLSTDSLASRHTIADARCAIVVAEPLRRLLSWTLSFYARRHGADVRPFRNAEEADAWLAHPTMKPGPPH